MAIENKGPEPLTGLAMFSEQRLKLPLRGYQLGPAEAIVASVLGGWGRRFVIEFSRQSGKDELIAQTIAYLLVLRCESGGRVVMANPTEGQGAISRRRLLARLQNSSFAGEVRKEGTRGVQLGAASAVYLSAAESANVRGDTADLLLLCNEAQDVDPDVWDARFDPMAAATDATTVFFGTPWNSHSLLARERRYALAQGEAGYQQLWQVRWEEVAATVEAYGRRVQARIAQLGAQHPFIRTEYCLEEYDGNGAMLDAAKLALMHGEHDRQREPQAAGRYALLLDVGGEAEADEAERRSGNPRRDSTALTVVQIVASGRGLPAYQVVDRRSWRGANHVDLEQQVLALADHWRAERLVVDATGLGMGIASHLEAALGERVRKFTFTAQSKSDLGWRWLACIEQGRYKEYVDEGAAESRLFWQQAANLQAEVVGTSKQLRWQVPGATLHDDLVISASLCVLLDEPKKKEQPSGVTVRSYL